MSDLMMETGGDLAFDGDLVFANTKETLVQLVVCVLRTMRGDNDFVPFEGTLVPTRHGMVQSAKTGEIIRNDVEQGLIESGIVGSDEFRVEVFPTGPSEIRVSITIDPNNYVLSEPIRIDFNYDVGTGVVEHLNGVIE
jgi:hypothetical protein